jgi:hypothetical protein
LKQNNKLSCTTPLYDTVETLYNICREGRGRKGKEREGEGREGKGKEGRVGKGRRGREGKGRDGLLSSNPIVCSSRSIHFKQEQNSMAVFYSSDHPFLPREVFPHSHPEQSRAEQTRWASQVIDFLEQRQPFPNTAGCIIDSWKIDSFLSEALPHLLLDIMNSPPLGGVSVFDGCGAMKKALTMHGIPTMGFDMKRNADEDIDTEAGFLKLILMILRVVPHGLVWFSVPCSSWLIHSKCGRTFANPTGDASLGLISRPWGCGGSSSTWVQMQNRIADRVSVLARLCHQRGVYFIIQQPAT